MRLIFCFLSPLLLLLAAAAPSSAAQLSFRLDLGHPVEALAFSTDGASLYAAPWDRTLRVLSVAGHRQVRSVNIDWNAWHIAVSPDGKTAAMAGTHNSIALLALPDLRPRYAFPAHADPVSALAFSPDGGSLLSGGWDGAVRVWPLPEPKTPTGALNFPQKITGLAFFGEGGLLAVAQGDGTLRLHEYKDLAGKRVTVLRLKGQPLLAASADGHWLAAADGSRVSLISPVSRRADRVLTLNEEAEAAAFSPDSSRFAAAAGGTVRVWRTSDWKETASFPAEGRQHALAFAPDGRRLACAGAGGMLSVWDLTPLGFTRLEYFALTFRQQLIKVFSALALVALLAFLLQAWRRARARAADSLEAAARARKLAEAEERAKAPPKPEPFNIAFAEAPIRPPLFPEQVRLIKRLADGPLGEVFLVDNAEAGRQEIFKRMRREVCASPAARQALLETARRNARLVHRNIAATYGLAESERDIYLRCEYAEARTAAEVAEIGLILPGPVAIKVAKDICTALIYAHAQGALHGELKTADIIIGGDGLGRVSDFGVTAALGRELGPGQQAGDLYGSLPYLAPERHEGDPGDATADLYSFGVVLYEMAVGVKPYHAAGAAALAEKKKTMAFRRTTEQNHLLPDALDTFLTRCLQADRRNRFQSAQEAWEQLRRI